MQRILSYVAVFIAIVLSIFGCGGGSDSSGVDRGGNTSIWSKNPSEFMSEFAIFETIAPVMNFQKTINYFPLPEKTARDFNATLVREKNFDNIYSHTSIEGSTQVNYEMLFDKSIFNVTDIIPVLTFYGDKSIVSLSLSADNRTIDDGEFDTIFGEIDGYVGLVNIRINYADNLQDNLSLYQRALIDSGLYDEADCYITTEPRKTWGCDKQPGEFWRSWSAMLIGDNQTMIYWAKTRN